MHVGLICTIHLDKNGRDWLIWFCSLFTHILPVPPSIYWGVMKEKEPAKELEAPCFPSMLWSPRWVVIETDRREWKYSDEAFLGFGCLRALLPSLCSRRLWFRGELRPWGSQPCSLSHGLDSFILYLLSVSLGPQVCEPVGILCLWSTLRLCWLAAGKTEDAHTVYVSFVHEHMSWPPWDFTNEKQIPG